MTTIYEKNELYENFTNPILTISLNSYEPQDFETYVTQDKNIEIITSFQDKAQHYSSEISIEIP